ncbi:RNA polymerase II-associated protein 1-like [Acanthaster planci]|uniref:RNA polymerase II-associated protein 1-like n=1 Tax=Acanthaster planci TaxID=133434 RepID=A0A8B7Y1X6_ACAPL|nr:RNA polymerase II-associated protein 1-like [Acanthaster planci]XP_022085939.1 RNA polymerase II-associated protein 1-like [Acanthaster planci]XP_022085940.1 RNA polymerase II-associated protein 1-like [Acanthaster planci]XP_022085941.1 RNA polymerase II-associated protein 1-like [Acanthaster planci]XP_022085942.1 RNA polymerase II-associated protein 1-like [Acanthaster planci]XP_022085943.1 RNA polymerase II-associated protein 1-like [Acanthaster planci]XP_022085945.1 RNA polymerase II-as
MIRRPKPGETEEDLLRQQEEFLAQQQSSAARVVKRPDKRKPSAEGRAPEDKTIEVKKDVVQLAGLPVASTTFESAGFPQKKKSRFKEQQTTVTGSEQRVTFDLDEDEDDPEEAMEKRDTHITSVLAKIMERDAAPTTRFLPKTSNQGFPSVLHRGIGLDQQPASIPSKTKKKQSLFARQFDRSSPSSFGVTAHHPTTRSPATRTANIPKDMQEAKGSDMISASAEISGSSGQDREEINRDNLDLLSKMSEEEILAEQRKLKAILDPSLVSFIQSRHKQKSATTVTASDSLTTVGNSAETSEPMETDRSACDESQPECHKDHKPTADAVGLSSDDAVADAVKEPERMDDGSVENVEPLMQVQDAWVHMDQVESEKLEWMKDLPKPSAKSKEGAQARFDFNGQLVARDAKIPVREGLHHHGEEQEVPGYSLEELFTLSRSAVTQQRVLALQTLARVIYNCRLNQLGGELLEPLIPKLLEAGALFLLRWSLDNSNEGVIAATMEGLAALLVQPGDEIVVDRVFNWHRGMEATPLHPGSSLNDAEDVTEEGEEIQEKDKSDPQVAKQDAIKGLLRMKILQRLRYILEVVRPPAPVVLNALAILVRISHHSKEAAYKVMKSPRLMPTILREFLPTAAWKHQEGVVSDVYGYPVVLAMKLVKVLCVAGRNIAASLLSGNRLMAAVVRYISVEPPDMQLNIAEAYELSTASLQVWRVCVGYGLACDDYRELYPLLMQQLMLFQRLSVHPLPSSEEESDVAVHRLQINRAAAFLGLLEGVVNVAGTAAELQAKLSMSNDKTQTTSSEPQPAPPSINWSHVCGLQAPLEFCGQRWLGEMTGTTQTLDAEVMDLVSCLLNLLASFYAKYTQQTCYRPVECLQNVEKLVYYSLVPFMTSATFYNVMVNLKLQSTLRFREEEVSTCAPSLPDLGCDPHNHERNYPSVRKDSSCGLAIGLLRLVHTLLQIHKGIAAKFCPIVENTYVTAYLKRICKNTQKPSSHLGCCFARFEHQALYYLLRLYHCVAQQAESCHQYSNLYHSAALSLFVHLQPGDEYYVHDLMSSVLFNTDFIAEGRIGDPIAADLADLLSMTAPQTSVAPSLSKTEPSRGELLQRAYEHLVSIRNIYMVFFGTDLESLARSRCKSLHQPHAIDSFMLPAFTGALLPVDWMFLPLLHLYTEAQKAEMHGKSLKALPPHILSALVDTLRWIYMLETWRPQSLKMVPQTAKIARLFCVFLIGSDLFLEDSVRHYLSPLLRLYTQPDYLKLVDFDVAVPGVSSFYDLFMELLTQYEAVSFGDPLFAHFVLLPMQQRFSVGIRKALWCEHADALRALNLPVAQLILPIENFLHPQETNLELLKIYLSSIIKGAVKSTWSPIMYVVALHHLNGFLFGQTGSDQLDVVQARLRLLRQVLAIKDQMIQHHLTCYQGIDFSSPLGFNLYPSIPPERAIILQAAQKR